MANKAKITTNDKSTEIGTIDGEYDVNIHLIREINDDLPPIYPKYKEVNEALDSHEEALNMELDNGLASYYGQATTFKEALEILYNGRYNKSYLDKYDRHQNNYCSLLNYGPAINNISGKLYRLSIPNLSNLIFFSWMRENQIAESIESMGTANTLPYYIPELNYKGLVNKYGDNLVKYCLDTLFEPTTYCKIKKELLYSMTKVRNIETYTRKSSKTAMADKCFRSSYFGTANNTKSTNKLNTYDISVLPILMTGNDITTILIEQLNNVKDDLGIEIQSFRHNEIIFNCVYDLDIEELQNRFIIDVEDLYEFKPIIQEIHNTLYSADHAQHGGVVIDWGE